MDSSVIDVIRNGTVSAHDVTAVSVFLNKLVYKLADFLFASAVDQGLWVIIKAAQNALARKQPATFLNGNALCKGCPVVSLSLVILIPA